MPGDLKKQWLIRVKPSKLDLSGCTVADLHFHSRYSEDGLRGINSILKKCRKKGVGIAITDHNTIQGSREALKEKHPFLVVPGVELTSKEGVHVLAYAYSKKDLEELGRVCIRPFRQQSPMVLNISLYDLLNRLKGQNCLVGAAHPYFGFTGLKTSGLHESFIKKIDFVEVLNRYSFKRWNNKAYRWALEEKKGITGGSDGHGLHDLGRVLTGVEGEVKLEAFLEEIRKRRSFVLGTESNMLNKAVSTLEREVKILAHANRFSVLKGQVGLNLSHYRNRWRCWVRRRRSAKRL